MPGVRSPRKDGGKFIGWYFDSRKNRKHFSGTHDRDETLAMARTLEDRHTQVRLGVRRPRSKAERSRDLAFDTLLADYMAWGCAKGGRGGRPWSADYTKLRRRQLTWWAERLTLKTLCDLEDILDDVEKASFDLHRAGDSGKTINDKVSSLSALCAWCVKRELLEKHPLSALDSYNSAPKIQRRAATREELVRVLQVAPIDRRLLYETAFISGLRRNELAQLTPEHVDIENEALRLDANWTKNRKSGLQPVPHSLLQRLLSFARSGTPDRIYKAAYRRSRATTHPPKGRLLYVPSHTAEVIYRDMKRAGVEKVTALGKLDFHALRTAYINFVLQDTTLSPTDMQDMARHGSLEMTKTIYGRARVERMRDAAQRISEGLCVPSAYDQTGAQNEKSATPVVSGGCASVKLAPALGLEPRTCWLTASRSAN